MRMTWNFGDDDVFRCFILNLQLPLTPSNVSYKCLNFSSYITKNHWFLPEHPCWRRFCLFDEWLNRNKASKSDNRTIQPPLLQILLSENAFDAILLTWRSANLNRKRFFSSTFSDEERIRCSFNTWFTTCRAIAPLTYSCWPINVNISPYWEYGGRQFLYCLLCLI